MIEFCTVQESSHSVITRCSARGERGERNRRNTEPRCIRFFSFSALHQILILPAFDMRSGEENQMNVIRMRYKFVRKADRVRAKI